MIRFSVFLLLMVAALPAAIDAQSVYRINAIAQPAIIDSGKLHAGGENTRERLAVNNYYFSLNGKPFIPVTGEFHFSRYPAAYWDESIKKMKAGGINTIATYVFWNMHEEHEGVFDWNGDLNLWAFIKLCAADQMNVIVRIGPFCHGEIRNGGLPDWLLAKPVNIRSNDSGYLFYVNRLYQQIGKQLAGLYFKDGGPVIGVQLENELQHSAAPWGLTYPGQPYDWTVASRDLASTHAGVSVAADRNAFAEEGNAHMRMLKKLAMKAGIDVPFYTATGWGYAAGIPLETLPVTAAYPYPGWTDKPAPSPFYLYKDLHESPDYSPVRYTPQDYPVFAAEIGVGIMSTYSRRPVVPANSTDALINRFLGSGANGIGYYMYHGGSTPKGDFYFNDEAYGYPKISYDFQAPIGEYGEVRPSYQRLKLLHFFINAFGDLLAPMQTVLPSGTSGTTAQDTVALRYAVREKDGSGFLFVNNFQDHCNMPWRKNIQMQILTAKGNVEIPHKGGFDLAPGENVIFPFHFDLNGVELGYATAQLLTKGGTPADAFYVFFYPGGTQAEFAFRKTRSIKITPGRNCSVKNVDDARILQCDDDATSSFTVASKGRRTTILVVPKEMALKSYLVNLGGEQRIVFSDALVLQDGNHLSLTSDTTGVRMRVFPAVAEAVVVNGTTAAPVRDGVFTDFRFSLPQPSSAVNYKITGNNRITVELPSTLPENINDVFLDIDYTGDNGMGFLNGKLVTDEFWKGIPWKIGLKRFIGNGAKEMSFYFRPVYRNAPFLIDVPAGSQPKFDKSDKLVQIHNVRFTPEYHYSVSFINDHHHEQ